MERIPFATLLLMNALWLYRIFFSFYVNIPFVCVFSKNNFSSNNIHIFFSSSLNSILNLIPQNRFLYNFLRVLSSLLTNYLF